MSLLARMDVYFVASCLLSFCYAVLILRLWAAWLSLKKPTTQRPASVPGVTIILPVRNEEPFITATLDSLLNQDYPRNLFEIIAINDYSTDETLYRLREYEQKGVVVLDMKNYLGEAGEKVPNKKKAIALGVKNARFDLLITTDGDTSRSVQWLTSLVSGFISGNYLLATAPVVIRSGWNPLSWFQQLDQLNMTAITGAAIAMHRPLMCNGANLIYTRQVFHDVHGFKGNEDVPGGDDYYLMDKVARQFPGRIGYIRSTDAAVQTEPVTGLIAFLEQRTRWVSKFSGFSFSVPQSILAFSWFFNLSVIFFVILAFRDMPLAWLPLVVIFSVKLFFDLLFNMTIQQFFGKWFLLPLLPAIEIFHVLYIFVIGLSSTGGYYRWKGRTINRAH